MVYFVLLKTNGDLIWRQANMLYFNLNSSTLMFKPNQTYSIFTPIFLLLFNCLLTGQNVIFTLFVQFLWSTCSLWFCLLWLQHIFVFVEFVFFFLSHLIVWSGAYSFEKKRKTKNVYLIITLTLLPMLYIWLLLLRPLILF